MPIQKMTIALDRIEMVIADCPEREEAKEWLEVSVPEQGSDEKILALTRLKALRAAQRLIDAEIDSLVGLLKEKFAALPTEDRMLVLGRASWNTAGH